LLRHGVGHEAAAATVCHDISQQHTCSDGVGWSFWHGVCLFGFACAAQAITPLWVAKVEQYGF
jgi:hypothetical protein